MRKVLLLCICLFSTALQPHCAHAVDDGGNAGNAALKKNVDAVFALIKSKRFEEAEKHLVEDVVPANEKQWIVHYLLGHAYFGQSKNTAALASFEKALSLCPPEDEADRKNIQSTIAKLKPPKEGTNIEIATLDYMIRQLPKVTNKQEEAEACDKILSKAHEILELDPDNVRVWHYQAKIALAVQNRKLAYDAGQGLLRLGAGSTSDAKLLETLAELNFKGLLHPSKEELKYLELPKTLTLELGGGAKMELVVIMPGTFSMGSPESEKDRSGDEKQHTVTIDNPFYMGKFAVTQEQYEAVMRENPSNFKGAKNPVETVSWDDAVKFCEKLSQLSGKKIQLPTEAQWEYACRAGTKTRFYTGDAEDDLARAGWYTKNSADKTHLVGQKIQNAFGLCDMHGNVWQWCQDWYTKDYEKLSAIDPCNNAQGTARVVRGGSWCSDAEYCRSAVRDYYAPGARNLNFGFRVVVAVPSSRTP